MAPHILDQAAFRGRLFALLAAMSVALKAAPALAQSGDDEATEISADAMSGDYADNQYSSARRKLQRAIKRCRKRCSPEVKSELYRNLGIVYVSLGNAQQANAAFEKSLELDSSLQIPSEWATPEVNAAFREAGGTVEESESEEEGESEDSESEGGESEDSGDSSARARRGKDKSSRNWLSLTLQQDWQLHTEKRPVCGSPEYTCFEGAHEYTGQPWDVYGNEVSDGLALATTRLLLGFDQLLSDHFAFGARVGFAFRGGPKLKGGSAFLPFHGELRIAYYFGGEPFGDGIVHPFLALGGGLAEVRSRVDVDYYEDAQAYNEARKERVDAWRKTGRAFVAPSLGAHFSLSQSFALTLELRWMAMFGSSGSAPAASVGFALGL